MQFLRLQEYGEPSIMVSVRDSHFDSEFELTTDDGLMIAFGITDFDDETESIEDASYGRLKGVDKTWGNENTQGVNFEEIPVKKCTRAQLGLPEIEGDLDSDYSVPPIFYDPHINS